MTNYLPLPGVALGGSMWRVEADKNAWLTAGRDHSAHCGARSRKEPSLADPTYSENGLDPER
jgi:hypothetical protein